MPEFAYRKVAVQGQFDHEHEMLLGPRTREGELGYHVITPLVRGEGEDVIMVNRGFVRRDHADKSLRRDSLVRISASHTMAVDVLILCRLALGSRSGRACRHVAQPGSKDCLHASE